MLRICKKLREADAKARRLGLVRTETDYLRALLGAMVNMDRLMEVEVLKTLGDVNLEKGQLHKNSENFDRAMMLYRTALLRCKDAELGESLVNRCRYSEKLRLRKVPTSAISCEQQTNNKDKQSMVRVAEKMRHLDRQLAGGRNKDTVLINYTKYMIEGIVNKDNILEIEAIKSLGDVHLKKGTETRDTTYFTKATALYNTALTALSQCEGLQGRVTLVHRLLYTAKVREKTENIRKQGLEQGKQQQIQPSLIITTCSGTVMTRTATGFKFQISTPHWERELMTSRQTTPDYRSSSKGPRSSSDRNSLRTSPSRAVQQVERFQEQEHTREARVNRTAEVQQGSQKGVRKYFYFVKEEVSSDWKDLAFFLGFGQHDIDNIASRNRDDKSRCMDLLWEWLKRNGDRATAEALIEALSEANMQSTVDGLEEKYPELHTSQQSSVLGKSKGNDFVKEAQYKKDGRPKEDVLKGSVKKYYEVKLTKFKPLIWNDDFILTLSDIFTQLELIQIDNNSKSEKRTELNSLDDLFNPNVTGQLTAPRCILIEGEAGGGKTTFMSKEALDAVSQKTELGQRHDFILLIRLREVRERDTIEEIVWDQCVPETTEGVDVETIRAMLQRNESHVLFLLDGYDELRPEARAARQAIPKLLSGKVYPNSTIVITSRPSAGVQQHTNPDCHVRIMGFSPEHVEIFVWEYFSIIHIPEVAGELIKILNQSQFISNLVHTPMFLMLICLLWEENPEMVSTGTITGLYSNLLTCLDRKHCKREEVDLPKDDLSNGLADALLQLGKLALEALLRNETLLDLSEVERENLNWYHLLKLGIVSLEVSASKLHPRKQLNFSHKTMQEFLAGRYLAHALESLDFVELLQLNSATKALELGNLLQFTCGCGSLAAQAVLKDMIKLSNEEFLVLQADMVKEIVDPLSRVNRTFTGAGVPDEKHGAMELAETYCKFVLLCIDILNERKEPDVLHAVFKALPFIIIDDFTNIKQAALKYYLENIQPPYRVILRIGLRDLEEMFTSSFPHVQLDLVISETLDSAASVRLVSVLKNVPGLRALDLSEANLTPSSLQLLVQGFRDVPLLEELDFSGNNCLGDAGMEVLQVGLPSVPHLVVLRFGRWGLKWTGQGISMTAKGMSSMVLYMHHLVGLRELDFTDNDIGDDGVESLTTVLSKFTAMEVLGLAKTNITGTGMRKLIPALRLLIRLKKLDISFNPLGDTGFECLAEILPRLKAMTELRLKCVFISDKGISGLIKALPYLEELQELDLCSNCIGDSGIVSLVQTLCHHCNSTLHGLLIGKNLYVTGAGLGRVARLIGSLTALTRLDMSVQNPVDLSDTDAMTLAEALHRLSALEWVDLSLISMESEATEAVMQALKEHPRVKWNWYRVYKLFFN